MAVSVVELLLENWKELLTNRLDPIAGAEHELRKLRNDVSLLKALVRDLAEMPTKEETLRILERELRKVVYEVEDTMDICLSEVAMAKSKSSFHPRLFGENSRLRKVVKSLRKLKVKDILGKALAYRATMAIAAAPSTSEEERWIELKKVNLLREDKVVGFQYEEETIIRYLLEGKQELDVISITGMSGLGKTTLARKIYRNVHIEYEFSVRIWIHVSQNLNLRDMLCEIMKSFTGQNMPSMSDDELSKTVRSYLNRGRFFLVLDDVCGLDDWKAIENILPKSNGKGKVLITSFQDSVGAVASVYRKPHKLRFLTEDESWELLQLEVFGNLEDCPAELESIGRVVARKCGGLPLQVVAVGEVLVSRSMKSQALGTTRKEWENVSEYVNLFLHNKKSLSHVVELTYSRLPDELRECFLYMGMFPEDYEIPSWTLTRLWIAEGFVQPVEGMSLEEIATQYLDDLIDRNLVMAGKINADGEVKTCCVHVMIRMFCIYKAQEQNLFHVIKVSRHGVVEPPDSEQQNCRRLCVDSNANRILPHLPRSQRARSFLYVNDSSPQVDPRHLSAVADAFAMLMVLESKSLPCNRIPGGISRLFHLRYLTLSVEHLKSLPETFADLWNLQTLVVDTTSHSIAMKANIWRLMRLRHLKTKAAIVLNLKDRGQAGENLQTLSRLSPESCTDDMCERACNLKTLGIRGELATLFRNSTLSKLGRLEKLKLLNDFLKESASENTLSHFPKSGFFPPNLRSLTLSNTFLHWKHMSTLAKISKLEVLKLKDDAFTGIYWNAADDCFTNLRFLLIRSTDLIQWEASTTSFPQLRCLVLKNCENLNVIPLALGDTLKRLDLCHVRKSAVDSAMRIEEKKYGQELEKGKWKWSVPFNLSIGPKSAVDSAMRIAEAKKHGQELEKGKWIAPSNLY